MDTIAVLCKTKDASGHEHGGDGKFTSSDDGGGKLESASGENYSTLRNHDQHIIYHDTHGGQSNWVGHATPHEKTGGFMAAYEREDHPPKKLGVHASVESAMRAVAQHHETVGHTKSGKGTLNDSDQASAELAALQPHKARGAIKPLTEIVTTGIRPLAGIVPVQKRTSTPEQRLAKRRITRHLRKYAAPDNTMEALIQQVADPAMAAVPCEAPPARRSEPYREGSHWLSVVGTEPERCIVHCDQENKTWSVPYSISGNEVVTGEPEEVGITFTPVNEDETGDDEAEGGSEPEE